MAKLTWSDLTLPPINLYSAPYMQPKSQSKKHNDNIRGITGQAAINYMAKLRAIDKMRPVEISVQDYSWR